MFITLRLEIIFDTLKRLIVDKIPTKFNLPGKKCFICISRCGLINGWLNEIAVFPIMTSQNWKEIVEKIFARYHE